MEKTEKIFEEQMNQVKSIKIPGLKKSFKPMLMQQYVVWRLGTDDFFFNTSGTGTGKTIAALCASKFYRLKMLVITNNSGVKSYYKDANNIGYNTKNMLVINYDKFSFETCIDKWINICKEFNPQLIVLDEVHNIKINEKSALSTRSNKIRDLISSIDYKKLLIQTATPVINNVSETESLIKIGKPDYNIDGLSMIGRKIQAYTTLVDISIGFPKSKMIGGDVYQPITYKKLADRKFISKVKYDNYNFENKYESMLPFIKKGTIIYTEYTEGIVDKLYDKLSSLYSVGKYTGEEKDVNFNDYDIMIITSAGSTGTDGLQLNFNRMIFFTLPNTWAAFEQGIGRIDRTGSKFDNVEFYYLLDDDVATTFSDQKSWYNISKKRIDTEMIRDGHINKSIENKDKLKSESKKIIAKKETLLV
jgi:superfamily II DNA or RNA helicase